MKKVAEALSFLLDDVAPVSDCETVAINEAHHRVLAAAQHSAINVPPANVSAMDGYALNLEHIKVHTPYPVSQRIAAGYAPSKLDPSTLARIFTGSVIPPGADTVVIQENTKINSEDGSVSISELPTLGANIRLQGQDIKADADLLPQGHRLIAQDLGLLASVGITDVQCYRKLRIGVLSSGDELVDPGQELSPGKIYNSNRFSLQGLVNSIDLDFVYLGHIADDLQTTIAALENATSQVDVILTTGGVSVGEEDHIKNAVQTLGELNLWKLAIKPGKPLAYGKINNIPFFGLPGNPVAVFVTFLMVVRPYLLSMQGVNQVQVEPIKLASDFAVTKQSPRQEYRRVRIEAGKVTEFHTQDSGVLTSTHWANALAVIPADTCIAKGELLDVYPFQFFNL